MNLEPFSAALTMNLVVVVVVVYKYAIILFPSEIVKLLAFINLHLIEEPFEDPILHRVGFVVVKHDDESFF